MPERQSAPGEVTTEPEPPPAGATEPSEPEQAASAPPQADRPEPQAERAAGETSPTSWFEAWEMTSNTEVIPKTTAGTDDPEKTVIVGLAGEPITQAPISQAIASVDPVTERFAVQASDGPTQPTPGPPFVPPPASPAADGGQQRPKRRGRSLVLAGGGALVALGLLYGGDLLLGQGSVPRGVSVAGVPIGGLSLADAEQRLRSVVEPRTSRPVPVSIGDARTTIDPKAAGLAVSWPDTMARAAEQPVNPITRLTSFFAPRTVEVASTAEQSKLEAAVSELSAIADKPAAEGTVHFQGVTPYAVDPVPGQRLDVATATDAVQRGWVDGPPVAIPLVTIAPLTNHVDVQKAIETVARPATSAPVTITGEGGTSATMAPDAIAAALTFRPGPSGGLVGEVSPTALEAAVRPALASSETPGRDASLDFRSGAPVVVPSQDGRGVDYAATATALGPVLVGAGQRQVAAVYSDQPAKLTTDRLRELGITGLVSEFTTRGFAADSGQNIKRAAEQINGKVVQPGETFSLNELTNPRDAAHGYVEAGIIEDGHPSRGIGGGVSQVATTLYNAAYFAGMTLVEHREHSFYISRYPPGREATVFDNIIDLKFRNDGQTGVMIQTVWTPSTITVRFFGTKQYEVTSATGPRTDPTEPKTVTIPAGQPCSPSKGAPGFTVTDTRTLRDLTTGQVRSDPTRHVRYNPSPIVQCEG